MTELNKQARERDSLRCDTCGGLGEICECSPILGGSHITPVQEQIAKVCDELKAFLLAKNKAYGNSALEPKRIFSRADTKEQILVRIDDKLSRIANRESYPGDDDVLDLLGYLVLLRVANRG